MMSTFRKGINKYYIHKLKVVSNFDVSLKKSRSKAFFVNKAKIKLNFIIHTSSNNQYQ